MIRFTFDAVNSGVALGDEKPLFYSLGVCPPVAIYSHNSAGLFPAWRVHFETPFEDTNYPVFMSTIDDDGVYRSTSPQVVTKHTNYIEFTDTLGASPVILSVFIPNS